MPDVSPTKWHRGAHHLVLRDVRARARRSPATTPSTPRTRTSSTRTTSRSGRRHPRSERGLISRPSVERGRAPTARTSTPRWRSSSTVRDRRLVARVAALVELGLHHEQQHQELLLMDIKHVLSCNPLEPAYVDAAPTGRRRRPPHGRCGSSTFDGGLVEIGHAGRRLLVRQRVAAAQGVPRAVPDRRPARDRGRVARVHRRRRLPPRRSSGSPTVGTPCRSTGGTRPLYWRRDDGDGWSRLHARRAAARSIAAEPVVHVSHYEADAFARWAGARLPTEFEWEHAVRDRSDRGRDGLTDDAPCAPGCTRAPRRRLRALAPGVRRRLAVDRERVPAVPALRARGRRGR